MPSTALNPLFIEFLFQTLLLCGVGGRSEIVRGNRSVSAERRRSLTLAADGFDRSLAVVGYALAVELVLALGLFALGWIACLLHRVPKEDLPLREA